MRKDTNPTASLLFAVAALQILVGVIGWFVHRLDADVEELRWILYSYDRVQFGWLDWAITFSGVIFAALGIVARWARLPAALFGAGLYGAFLALHASEIARWPMTGLFIKIPVAILLLAAVASAFRHLIQKGESEHDAAS